MLGFDRRSTILRMREHKADHRRLWFGDRDMLIRDVLKRIRRSKHGARQS